MTGLSFGLVKDGEPIPQECGGYPMRTGNLCLELSGRGHEVCWYSSTFSHHQKTFRFEEDTTLLELGFRQRFLSSGGYTRNISPGRFLHHSRFALKLYKELLQTPRLDVIVCCIPMLEAALASTLAANRRGIPLVLDIRDPWPDVFLTLLPRALRPAGAVVFYPYRELARRLFARADSLTACSEGFLEWAQRISARPAIRREQDRVFFHGAHCPPVDPSALPQAWQTGPGVIRHIYLGGFGRNYDFEVMEKVIKALAEDRRHHFFYGRHR